MNESLIKVPEHPAIVILTFARPQYFELVLQSLLSQTVSGKQLDKNFDIFIYQDGIDSNASDEVLAEHGAMTLMLDEFRRTYNGQLSVKTQQHSLGIGLHYDAIEREIFLDKRYEYAFFFEDDLILGPGYLQALESLRQRFQHDSRVGMVSAFSEHGAAAAEQRVSLHSYSSMGHSWGFGISRDFWMRRQPFIDLYLRFLKSGSYKERPAWQIFRWLETCGFNPRASSQDFVKTCATVALGTVRVSTFPNYGFQIGRFGEHFQAGLDTPWRYDAQALCDQEILEASPLSDQEFSRLLADQSEFAIRTPNSFTPIEWIGALESGEFTPLLGTGRMVSEATPAHVELAYQLFLARDPENRTVVQAKTGLPLKQLLTEFLLSDEFLTAVENRELIEAALSKFHAMGNPS